MITTDPSGETTVSHVGTEYIKYNKYDKIFFQDLSKFSWKYLPETIVIINKKTGKSCQFNYSSRNGDSEFWYKSIEKKIFTGNLVLTDEK